MFYGGYGLHGQAGQDEQRRFLMRAYSAARPPHAEGLAVWIAAYLANEAACRNVNLLHLSSRKALEAARAMAGVFPHIDFRREITVGHLLLDVDVPTAAYAKVNPPIRPREDVEFLWRAVLDGGVDWIVSDHACCAEEVKAAGRAGTGDDADLALLDPDRRSVVRAAESPSAQGYTPFEGQELTGRVTATFLRGALAWEDGAVRGDDHRGQRVRQGEPLLLPLPDPPAAYRRQRTVIQRDRAAGPAHDPVHVRVVKERTGQVGTDQAGPDRLRWAHDVHDQVPHLVHDGHAPRLGPYRVEQPPPQLVLDAVGHRLGVGGDRGPLVHRAGQRMWPLLARPGERRDRGQAPLPVIVSVIWPRAAV